MSNLFYIFLYASAMIGFCAMGDTIEDLKKTYAEIIMSCSKEYPLTPAYMQQIKEGKMPDDSTVKCLFACAYKKVGMMDDKGMLSVDGMKKISQKYFADNPEKMKKADEFTQACMGVNAEQVSDGEKGCDRAALMFKCTVEKAPQFEFV